MKAIVDGDLVVGTAAGRAGGLEIPEALQGLASARLRVLNGEVIDIAGVMQFFVDGGGRKHIVQGDPAWQPLACAWDDALVFAAGQWHVQTAAEWATQVKSAAKARLAAAAERERQRYITPGDGKAAVYLAKREESRTWQSMVDAGQTPDPADFPWLAARATRLVVPPQEVADEWTARAAAWEAVGRTIEDAYEAAVESIEALQAEPTLEADCAAVVAGVSWSA